MDKKQKTKQYLDSMLSDSLQETLERKAQSYKKHGLEKQAKKVRAFKKEVRKMVGSLWLWAKRTTSIQLVAQSAVCQLIFL